MAQSLPLILAFVLGHLALTLSVSDNVVNQHQLEAGTSMSVKALEQVFSRSEETHQESMSHIAASMTVAKAARVLEKSKFAGRQLTEATSMALTGNKQLRKPGVGYSGIEGARKMLNDMIFESMTKYDSEIAKCVEYYSAQCTAMEACRSEISAANFIAANSRMLILDSQSVINRCEVDIPTRKLELKQHLLKCKNELKQMNERLKIILGDIEIMTMILEMTDCEKKFVQGKFSLLHCEDQCHRTFVKFDHDGLQQKISQLQSVSHGEVQDTFGDLFEGLAGLEDSEEFIQTGAHQTPLTNKTQFNNPPTPRTPVPMNPCTDPNEGAPSAADKAKAKCSIKKSPQCYKLQERFLLIQSGIKDNRDELMSQIASLEAFCEETKKTLEDQISEDESALDSAQTKLAAATEKEAAAGETARKTNDENAALNSDLEKQMKTCSENYINFETELCALKKIRGELYKMKGSGHSAFFQDCEVSKWSPEECTKTCAGGEQKLTRGVLTHPNGGAKCLPLAAERSCNNHPCPINCKVSTWSGWSKCSAECGGGVQQRLKEVKMAMKYGGNPCGETSQTKACHAAACEKDCELSEWTKWSGCSKDCDGGTRKRSKFIKVPAQGAGACADAWGSDRLQYMKCNMIRCRIPAKAKVLTCNKTMDVILLLDGSGSMGKKGFAAEIISAKYFVDAFKDSGKVNMAVILYSGPRTWAGVRLCVGKSKKKVNMEKTCKIKFVTHYTDDLKKVTEKLNGLEFPKGSTLTSLALMTAKAELPLGNKKARAHVIVFTDGRPLSYRSTYYASKAVRTSARLIFVAISKKAPLKYIKWWATRRWQENVVSVKSRTDLSKPDTVTHVIADICPKKKGANTLSFARSSPLA